MSDLKTQALRLILAIDEALEPLQDTFEPLKSHENAKANKLSRLLIKAECRYYRRSQVQASPWSLVTRIVEQHKQETAALAASEALAALAASETAAPVVGNWFLG